MIACMSCTSSSKNVLQYYYLTIFFSVGTAPQQLMLQLPIFLTKCSVSAEMSVTDFFNRWKGLSA